MNDEREAALAAEEYWLRFNLPAPLPMNVDSGRYAKVLREHIRKGVPVSPDYDFWADLPDGAVS